MSFRKRCMFVNKASRLAKNISTSLYPNSRKFRSAVTEITSHHVYDSGYTLVKIDYRQSDRICVYCVIRSATLPNYKTTLLPFIFYQRQSQTLTCSFWVSERERTRLKVLKKEDRAKLRMYVPSKS